MFRFDGTIAKMTSPNAAVIFHHISFCVTHNERNGINLIDGKYWTFDSRKSYTERFFYMTEDMVRTAIKKLVDAGLIEKGNFATDKMDNRNWYTLTELGWEFNYWRKDANGNLIEDVIATDNPKVLLGEIPHKSGNFTHKSGKQPQPTGEISPVNTDIYHTDNKTTDILIKKEKNNARTREAIIADIKTENQLWIDNMMMHHKVESENEVLELAAWGYDQVALKGNEPTRGDIMKYCNAHVSDWREYKRREAIKAIPINDRRMALWDEVCKYREEYSYTIRFNWTERMVKPSKSDPDIMIFEEQPGLNVPVELNKYKLRYEQRNQHTAL